MIEADFDSCIRISPHCDHDKLIYTELAANTRQLIATPDYLAAYGAPEKPSDLSKHRLITHTKRSTSNYWHFRDGSGTRSIDARGHLLWIAVMRCCVQCLIIVVLLCCPPT